MSSIVNIGFGSFVLKDKINCVLSPESAPIKRYIQIAKEKNKLIDATYGRKTRAVIIIDNGDVILAAIHPETISNRILD